MIQLFFKKLFLLFYGQEIHVKNRKKKKLIKWAKNKLFFNEEQEFQIISVIREELEKLVGKEVANKLLLHHFTEEILYFEESSISRKEFLKLINTLVNLKGIKIKYDAIGKAA